MNHKVRCHVPPPLSRHRGQTWPKLTLMASLLPLLTGCTETLLTKSTPPAAAPARVTAQPVPPAPVRDAAPPPVKPKTAAKPAAEREPLPWPPKKEPKPTQEAASPRKLYEWRDPERRVTRIVINTDEQRAHFYDGEDEVGWSTVATGTKTHPTPSGEFEVLEKMADKASNLYGRIYNRAGKVVNSDAMLGRDPIPPGGRFVGAKMPNFLRVTYDGVGLHAGLIPRPGSPASHGCVRMPEQVASSLYERVAVGTKVSVIGSGPNHGNYAVRIKEQRRAQEEARRIAAAKAAKAAAVRAQKLAAARAAKKAAAARAAQLAQAEAAAGAPPDSGAVTTPLVTPPVTAPVDVVAAPPAAAPAPVVTATVPTPITLPPPLPVVPPAPAVSVAPPPPAAVATPLPPPPAPTPVQPVPTPAAEVPTPAPATAPSAAPPPPPTGMLPAPASPLPAAMSATRRAAQRAI